MALNESEIEKLKAEMANNGGKAARAAADLGLNYEDVVQYLEQAISPKFNNDRPELRRYIIATKNINGGWPSTEAIDTARFAYDRGVVELCQYREGQRVHLLSIPRRQTVNRPPYFGRDFADEVGRRVKRGMDRAV